MGHKKITIEIEIESMNGFDLDYTNEFSTKLQRELNNTVERQIKGWNRWRGYKMRLKKISNTSEP